MKVTMLIPWPSGYLRAVDHSVRTDNRRRPGWSRFYLARTLMTVFILFCVLPMAKVAAYDGISCSNGVYKYYKIWGPEGAHYTQWFVDKWKQPIRYVVNDFTGDSEVSRAIDQEVAKEMPKFASAIGLSIKPDAAKGNVLIVITNDMPKTDLDITDAVREMYLAAGYVSNIDAMQRAHHELIVKIAPRCGGVVVGNIRSGNIGAVLYLDVKQKHNCVITAISQLFAIGFDWNSPSRHGVAPSDSTAIESEALSAAHELYDPSFKQGMKDDDVAAIMKRDCK